MSLKQTLYEIRDIIGTRKNDKPLTKREYDLVLSQLKRYSDQSNNESYSIHNSDKDISEEMQQKIVDKLNELYKINHLEGMKNGILRLVDYIKGDMFPDESIDDFFRKTSFIEVED